MRAYPKRKRFTELTGTLKATPKKNSNMNSRITAWFPDNMIERGVIEEYRRAEVVLKKGVCGVVIISGGFDRSQATCGHLIVTFHNGIPTRGTATEALATVTYLR